MKCQRVRTILAFTLLIFGTGIVSAQTYTVLYNLGSHSGDPWNPVNSGIIAQGRDGNLYTTAPQGDGDSGAVFSVTPAGVLTVVHPITGSDGIGPTGGLTLATDGNFYGTTSGSGFVPGTVFKVTSTGTLSTLYTFMNNGDGEDPGAPPIQGVDGKFYGTAMTGSGIYGTAYKLTTGGIFTVLHTFDFTTGAFPEAPLLQSTNGDFYGTTEAGATNNLGNVFKLTSSGTFTSLFIFDGTHGQNPFAPLIQGSDGNFYGTTKNGGASNLGTVFKITPIGSITVLHSFAGTTDGAGPVGGLVLASDGNFYGTTSMATGTSGCGTIFRVNSSGSFTNQFTFPSDGSMGCNPLVTLNQHTNGMLYGDTLAGGVGNNNHGVFFSFNASLPAFVKFLPSIGKVGATIEFLGQGFIGTTSVSFSGTPASFTVVSDNYLTSKVPSGATTGTVTVTTPKGKLNSNAKFRVSPQVISFSPTSGPAGTVVTITGVSLSQTTRVSFGGVNATTFTVNSDTQVTATVPTGAKTGKISITTPGGTASSSSVFTVTT
jgi:uncharacterized repeat protein (TIGR03803 family)